MTKIQLFAILALGGLAAFGASGQTGSLAASPSIPADENAIAATDNVPSQNPDAALTDTYDPDNPIVTLIEPYDGYGEVSLDELSAALSMPAGSDPWDLGEFARWQEPPNPDAYSEPVIIIDEGQAIVGTFELPADYAEYEGQGELAAAQPQALPPQTLSALPPQAMPALSPQALPAGLAPALPALAGVQQPMVPDVPLAFNALTSAYGDAGTVYATTADYSCEPPMYAPVYSSYYYAYPYAYASAEPWGNPHWPLRSSYYISPPWPDYCGTNFGYPYSGYYGTYASYPYSGYYGTYASYPYGGCYSTYASYPYGGYFGTYYGRSYGPYFRGYSHPRYFGSGAFLGLSFGRGSWNIYGQLGIYANQSRYFRSGHDRDDFFRHSGSRGITYGGASHSRSYSSGAAVRPWRPGVSHQIATARGGRSYDPSTDRSRLGTRGPVEFNSRGRGTAGGAASATALQRPAGRTLTTGGRSGVVTPALGRNGGTLSTPARTMAGTTANDTLQQRRDAYMNVLRGHNAGTAGRDESLSTGGVRPAFRGTSPARTGSAALRADHGFGTGTVPRRSSAPDIDPAISARRDAMRNDLLKRLSATPGGSGSAPATAGPTRPHNTFQPQVAPRQPVSPGGPATLGRLAPTPRSLAPQSATPRTTSTVPSQDTRFSRSTWPHSSATTPNTTTTPPYTPRTFTPRTLAPSQTAPNTTTTPSYTPRTFTPRTYTPSQTAPNAAPTQSYTPRTFTPRAYTPSQTAPNITPSQSYTPRTYTPRTYTPSQTAPSAAPTQSYTPRTFTPRTYTPSQTAPSATPSPSYAPRSFTPRTYTPSQAAQSAAPTQSYTPRTFTPRTSEPSSAESSFSRSAPSFSRSSPAPREQSRPTMSAPPARTYSPAPSQAPSMSRSDRSGSYSSQRSAPSDGSNSRGRRR